MLEPLARQYRELGLPVPPPNAPPLLLPMNSSSTDDGKTVNEYVLGFRLTAASDKDHPGTFLVGTEVWDPSQQRTLDGPILPVAADQPLTAQLHEGPAYIADFPSEVWLSTAIQCQMLGYPKLASQIVERDMMHVDPVLLSSRITPPDANDLGAMHFLCREINGGDPRKALAAAAWNHWLNTLFEAATDRREALTRLGTLYTKFPAFKGQERKHLLASLRLSVALGKGKPGTPEALIDALSESTQASLTEPFPAQGFGDPNLTQLFELGFAAMPALIAHMKDKRLMREVELPLDAPPELSSVGQIITQLVEAAAGAQLFPSGTKPRAGEYDSPKLARQWWQKAAAIGEKEYVRAHVFPAEKRKGEYQWINEYCLWIVVRKYPQYLSEVYERLLQTRPDLYCEEVAYAVTNCEGLSREERVRLLHLGSDDPELERREDALSGLLELDEPDANSRLLQELARLPPKASAPRVIFSPEEEIAWLVRKSNSPQVWAALARTARRVEPDLRAQLIDRINDGHSDFPPREVERLAFLRAFIDDEAVWHEKEYGPRQDEDGRTDAGKDHAEGTRTVGQKALLAMGRIVNIYYPDSDPAKD